MVQRSTPGRAAAEAAGIGAAAAAEAATIGEAAGGAPATGSAQLDQAEAETAALESNRPAPGRDTLQAGSFAEAAAAVEGQILREAGMVDPGAGALHLAERTEGFTLRPLGAAVDDRVREAERAYRGPGVTREILPRTDLPVDPDSVPGHRYATVATQLRRDGLTYQPGERVKVDFRAHSQLVPIGAILPAPWHGLPEVEAEDLL